MLEKLEDLKRRLSEMFTVQTQEVIDKLNQIINEEYGNEPIPENEQIYASALAYLKSVKYKWAHLIKDKEKLLETARKAWFEG